MLWGLALVIERESKKSHSPSAAVSHASLLMGCDSSSFPSQAPAPTPTSSRAPPCHACSSLPPSCCRCMLLLLLPPPPPAPFLQLPIPPLRAGTRSSNHLLWHKDRLIATWRNCIARRCNAYYNRLIAPRRNCSMGSLVQAEHFIPVSTLFFSATPALIAVLLNGVTWS